MTMLNSNVGNRMRSRRETLFLYIFITVQWFYWKLKISYLSVATLTPVKPSVIIFFTEIFPPINRALCSKCNGSSKGNGSNSRRPNWSSPKTSWFWNKINSAQTWLCEKKCTFFFILFYKHIVILIIQFCLHFV